MLQGNRNIRTRLAAAVSLSVLAAGMPGVAMAAPSTVSMLEAMVAGGVLSQVQADKILQDAEARDAARATKSEAVPEGTKRVVYVPETVKQSLRDEIKTEVMAQAKAENWAAPNSHPEWTDRIKFSGDIRSRYEGTFYPDGNVAGPGFTTNYNTINNGSPLKISNPNKQYSVADIAKGFPEPMYDVDENRSRARIRARLGVDANLGEDFSTGMRLATGSGSDPVSTNQSLGGSGGNFSKYQVWLDRAFLRWDAVKDDRSGLTATVGRFDNPFFGTDLIWDGDLGFDGVAVTGSYEVAKGVRPFATIGAFPVYNTDLNFSSYQPEKSPSEDKWLYGAQVGTDWTPMKDTGVKVGAGYYYFHNVAGRRSSPCVVLDATTSCDTDGTRTAFSQKGNTYMGLRDLRGVDLDGNVANGDENDFYQYFGLGMPFHELALTGKLDYDGYKNVRVSVEGEFVKNLAFSRKNATLFDNNFNSSGEFDGGDMGYLMRVSVGSPKLADRWDWKASVAYKYLESDAVVDGLTDSDFGMGGTNLKGFILGGDLALAKNVWASMRWMSADNIGGAPFAVDIVQAEVSARF